MHLRRPFGIPAIFEDTCGRDSVVNHAVVLIGYGHSTEHNKAGLAPWQHMVVSSCGVGYQLSCFWICCFSLARTIGTFAILGEMPGEKVDLFACCDTVATREKLVTAEWIAIQRPWLEALVRYYELWSMNYIMILWSNVWCALFCIWLYFQLPCNRMTMSQEGTGCDNGPPTVPVCGMCGVLSES